MVSKKNIGTIIHRNCRGHVLALYHFKIGLHASIDRTKTYLHVQRYQVTANTKPRAQCSTMVLTVSLELGTNHGRG